MLVKTSLEKHKTSDILRCDQYYTVKDNWIGKDDKVWLHGPELSLIWDAVYG